MKFNRWVDTSIDTNLYLQLQDLTSILSGNAAFTFEYAYGSAIDLHRQTVTGASLWDMDKQAISVPGYKTDIFLRTIGTLHDSNIPALQTYLQETEEESHLPKFATQLITLLEDIRLEEMVKHLRPGTKHDFAVRANYLKHYFETQLATNVTRSYALDELFCLIYLTLQADRPDPDFPDATMEQLDQLEKLKPFLYSSFEAKSTAAVTNIAEKIVFFLTESYQDMINDYFIFPIAHVTTYEKD